MSGYVTELRYLLDTSSLFEAPPVVFTNSVGTFHLEADVVEIRLAGKHTTISSARRVVEQILKAWIVESRIVDRPPDFEFAFVEAATEGEVEDHNDHPPEDPNHKKNDEGPLLIFSKHYPPAPTIRLTEELAAMWSRYSDARYDFGEPIPSAAYFIFTVLKRRAGGLRQASEMFGADQKVLRKLSELSTTRGDLLTARKAEALDSSPLDRKEKRWLDHAIRLLLLNVGSVAAGVSPNRISMSDLPELP